MIRPFVIVTASFYALAMLPLASCGGSSSNAPAADHGHDHVDGGHDHDHAAPAAPSTDGHSHGAVIELGELESGGFMIRASRDGDVKAGGDAPIDVWVNGGKAGNAVRFWIGTEDAKGSIKAKAEVEVDHWHTHVEVPDPMPAGTKLWVEIEGDAGAKTVVSFDLKI
jgi:hypothetical protein